MSKNLNTNKIYNLIDVISRLKTLNLNNNIEKITFNILNEM